MKFSKSIITFAFLAAAVFSPQSYATITEDHKKVNDIVEKGDKKVQEIMKALPSMEKMAAATMSHMEECTKFGSEAFKSEIAAAKTCLKHKIEEREHMLDLIQQLKQKEPQFTAALKANLDELKKIKLSE